MTQDLRNLFNQALAAIGNDPVVTDPAGSGRAQDMLRLWYPVARHAVFTAFHWPSIRAIKLLGRVATRDPALPWANTDPAPDYMYSYSLPSDLLLPQYMENYAPFRLGRVGTERLIFSNDPTPILCYTMDEEVPSRWEVDLYRCVVWALAACCNMSRSGKMAVTQKLEEQVLELVGKASENAANSDDTYYDAIPSFYAGSGFIIPAMESRFVYPTSTFRVSGMV